MLFPNMCLALRPHENTCLDILFRYYSDPGFTEEDDIRYLGLDAPQALDDLGLGDDCRLTADALVDDHVRHDVRGHRLGTSEKTWQSSRKTCMGDRVMQWTVIDPQRRTTPAI